MTKNKSKNNVKNLKDSDIVVPFSKMRFENSAQTPATSTTGFRHGKRRRGKKEIKNSFEPVPRVQGGLLVTAELDKAMAECKEKVEDIAKQCRATNRKFRDIEFDLEKDQYLCRFGLSGKTEDEADVAVKRVTEIFDKPVFFGPDGPNASDVRQGDLGDCWFLAALSTVSTVPGLVEKFCVARDEEVGIYGFIFFRDCHWQTVIIDDLLFWSPAKFDELTAQEKQLFHNERHIYHQVVEKTGKGLLYARSGTVGETWVPLIEKAYAKFHGDYASLDGGFLSDGIEDLTGGVATSFQMSDLLNPTKFWTDELLHADLKTRLFGVSLEILIDEERSQELEEEPTVQGLFAAHAYSVLRACECKGKRFVVVRNPWGDSEWTGRWGDGAKEWKGEWLDILKDLDHEFGDDGQFVMEYSDFLEVFSQVDRATLFDASWSMFFHWLRVPPQRSFHPWAYGDVIYYFTLDKASSVVVVLSQMDHRYFQKLNGEDPWWLLDFLVFKKEPVRSIGTSGISLGSQRSVSCELYLEAGDYVVLPRVEPRNREAVSSTRKFNRVLTERAKSRSFVTSKHLTSLVNKNQGLLTSFLPPYVQPLNHNLESNSQETDLPMSPEEIIRSIGLDSDAEEAEAESHDENEEDEQVDEAEEMFIDYYEDGGPDNSLYLGLRVYTQNGAIATISGESNV